VITRSHDLSNQKLKVRLIGNKHTVLLGNAMEELDYRFLAMNPNLFQYSHHHFPHPHSPTTGFNIGLDSSMAFHSLKCEIPTIPIGLERHICIDSAFNKYLIHEVLDGHRRE